MQSPDPNRDAAPQSMALAELPSGVAARVISVAPTDPGVPEELSKRLAELGFLPGEPVHIVGRGWLAREPLAVRIGTGTFALRLFEAACVQVRLEPPSPT
jgi:ferrous iron transport protein A